MENVLIVIHLMVVLALVAVVLLQRSEGGALGIGGGGAGGGFMSARGSANVLTRLTGILAVVFFGTSIALTVLARLDDSPADILNKVEQAPANTPTTGTGNVLDSLKKLEQQKPAAPAGPQVPNSQ